MTEHLGTAGVVHRVHHCRMRWCGQWPPPPHPLSDAFDPQAWNAQIRAEARQDFVFPEKS